MGVDSVIAGLDPSMAITLVEMGLLLTDVETTLNLETAFDRLKVLNSYEESDDLTELTQTGTVLEEEELLGV